MGKRMPRFVGEKVDAADRREIEDGSEVPHAPFFRSEGCRLVERQVGELVDAAMDPLGHFLRTHPVPPLLLSDGQICGVRHEGDKHIWRLTLR